MKFNFPINNFSSGEWSPRMMGRTDTDQYARACEELTNFLPQMTGGAAFRGGTLFKPFPAPMQDWADDKAFESGEVLPPLGAFKLVPYTPFSSLLSKIILIGPDKWWLWPANSPLGTQPTYGTNAGPGLTDNSWSPQDTRYTVLGDVIVITNMQGTHKPKVFWYNTNTSTYRVDDIDSDYITSQPWKTIPWGKLEALDSNVTLNPSGTTGTITITASSAYFVGNDNGTYLRFANGTAVDGVAKITSVNTGTNVTAQVLQTLPTSGFAYGSTANSASFWQQSAWSKRYGWPRTVIAHQGRLIFGGTFAKPDTIWGSRISNYFDFQEIPSPNTTGSTGFANSAFAADNSRPFALTPNSPEASSIVALSSGKTLTIHTTKSEIVAYGSNGSLGPVNVVFESSTSYGAAPVQPVRVNNFVTFVQATGRSVRDIVFNFDENQFKSTDLAFVADHLFTKQESLNGVDAISEMCRTEDTSSILWARTYYGQLRLVTLDRDYQVNAWARVDLGSTNEPDDQGTTTPHVLSICNFPIANNRDALYALTYRVVNGIGRVFLEAMQPPWELANPANNTTYFQTIQCIYTDLTIPATQVGTTNVWTTDSAVLGASPFRGAKVSVVADGNYIGDFDVADTTLGEITLPHGENYEVVYAGLPYKGRIVTVPIEQGGQTGVPAGRQKRINELVIRFFKSIGTSYGKPSVMGMPAEMQEIAFREPGTPMNQAVEYFTGDKVVPFPPGYDRRCQVVIEQNKPYPCHIIAVIPQGTTYD